MSILLDLPEAIGEELIARPEAAHRLVMRELALTLYAQGQLPPGQAASVAGMDRWEFTELAAARGIELPYTEEMLAQDIAYGSGGE